MSISLEIERLPVGWSVQRIKDVVTFTKRPRGFRIQNDAVPFIPMGLIPAARDYVQDFEYRGVGELSSGTYVERGDLLITKITPCFENGKQGIVRIENPFAFATTEVIPIRGILGICDSLFLHYVLRHPELRSRLASTMQGTTGRQRLRHEILQETVIPIPPLPEQRRIASILSAVQRAIEQQERLIALTTELKKALMHKLFTEGTRGEAQKMTEIGLVPESWEVVRLGALINDGPTNGLYKPKDLYGRGTRILRIDDFSNEGDIVYNASNRVEVGDKDIATFRLSENDVVVNRVNSLSHLGKTALIGKLAEPMIFESNMMRLRVDDRRLLPEFLFRFLNSEFGKRQIIGSAKRAVAQSSINQGDVGRLILPLPDLQTQTEIVDALATVESKRFNHEGRSNQLTSLFRSLLHQLMTAQIRVTDIDLSELGIENEVEPVDEREEEAQMQLAL